ncbi:hypothetical protein A6U87_03260 [Rhizobium sp. AC44/96]|jgi:hypothetical protein|uniref:hypothetical protein n=1 Tax=unclassified Rhizobium TaxID=2613769 RepID=UPI00080FB0E8|nr:MULTISPECIES: hypothetical protein [unclassified Rhizobium]MDM9623635.1 hypothetical protein [Rhizobium sp. S96]OCJ17953.1 hypothetical protein A6U87_03260 [Rhizobium sp. AC44/96]
MIAPELAADTQAPMLGPIDPGDAFLPMELLELELSLETYNGDADFCEAVRVASTRAGGEFLFDLPADGLMDNCKRIAVLRIPSAEAGTRIVLAVLDQNGTEIRIEAPPPESGNLVQFAEAFITVLERF